MKKILLFVIIGIILIKGLFILNKTFPMFDFPIFDKNRIKITSDDIPLDNFKIFLKTTPDIADQVIIFDGHKYYDMLNEHGENDWTVIYQDSLVFSFRHYKTNCRYRHRYFFEFYFENDTLFGAVNIKGRNKDYVHNQFSLLEK